MSVAEAGSVFSHDPSRPLAARAIEMTVNSLHPVQRRAVVDTHIIGDLIVVVMEGDLRGGWPLSPTRVAEKLPAGRHGRILQSVFLTPFSHSFDAENMAITFVPRFPWAWAVRFELELS